MHTKKVALKPGEIAMGSPRANKDRLAVGEALGTLPWWPGRGGTPGGWRSWNLTEVVLLVLSL